jgi:hypothetical protein
VSRPEPGPDLLTLIAQAREATSDLRAAMKDLKTARQEAETAVAALLEDAVVGQLDAAVARETAAMGEQFRQATAAATAKVARVCDELYQQYLRGESRRDIPLSEVMAARQLLRRWEAQQPP